MQQQTILMHNVRLIDGSGAQPPDEPQALLIRGQRIEAVAPARDLAAPEGALTIDGRGMTVLPGLIDCHDHLADLEGSMRERAAIPPTLAVFMAARVFEDTLLGGCTSVRDASGVDLGMKLAVEQGLIPGPRLKISVVMLSQFGGHNDHTEPAGVDSRFPQLATIPSGICDGVDACRRKVREVIRAGADWIKIATTGGIGTPVGGPLTRQFSLDEVRAIVDTAHAAGKPVMSHAYGGDGVRICLEAGVDSIEHGAALDETLVERMAEQGTWLVPTFSVLRRALELGEQLPEYMTRKARALIEQQRVSFRHALEAGVRIAMGTDAGGLGHGHNARELGFLVEAGMTPMQAIVAATKMGAQLMGLDGVGTLSAGHYADLLLVDGDPLDDVRILEDRSRLRLIMKDGTIYKHDPGSA